MFVETVAARDNIFDCIFVLKERFEILVIVPQSMR
jgi:hypothetical protein